MIFFLSSISPTHQAFRIRPVFEMVSVIHCRFEMVSGLHCPALICGGG